MVLLLAVEPDARQAANLATVLRARPRTELVIAESAVRALQTLGSRVPDVLLTSALISRQDEMALAAWLKNLGPAAAHVQELTIPLLATSAPPPPKKRRGVLATLRRERTSAATPDGCDPDAFAEQVSGYMDRATAGRAPAPTIEEKIAPTREAKIAPTIEEEIAPTSEAKIAPTTEEAFAPTSEAEVAPTIELLLLSPAADVAATISVPAI